MSQDVDLPIKLTPQAMRMIDELVDLGLCGLDRSDAAERLVLEGLRRLVADGVIEAPKPRKVQGRPPKVSPSPELYKQMAARGKKYGDG